MTFDAFVLSRERLDSISSASSNVASSGNGGSVKDSSSKVASDGKWEFEGDSGVFDGGRFERPSSAAFSSKSASPTSPWRLSSGPSSRWSWSDSAGGSEGPDWNPESVLEVGSVLASPPGDEY